MKKVIAAILILAVAVCLAACKNKKNTSDSTTELITAAPGGVTQVTPAASGSEAAPGGVTTPVPGADSNTMVLTTQTGATVPVVPTTAVVLDPAAVTALSTSPFITTGSPYLTTPPVVTSQQPGVTYVTAYPTQSTQYQPTQSAQPTQPTQPVPSDVTPTDPTAPTQTPSSDAPTTTTAAPNPGTRTSKTLVISDVAAGGGKKVYLDIDQSGWNSSFKRNSGNVSVTVDGRGYTVPASIDAGSSRIVVDLSSVEVEDGARVTVSVPSSFVQTSDGTQYNNGTSVSGSVYF